MAKKVTGIKDWYFDGYEKQDVINAKTGKKETKRVYTGILYSYRANNLKREKTINAVLCFLILVFAVSVYLFPSFIFKFTWIGTVGLIRVVSIVYLLIGFITYLVYQEPLTIRKITAGYKRVVRWLTIDMIVAAFLLVSTIIMSLVRNDLEFTNELMPIGALAIDLVLQIVLLKRIRQYPPLDIIEE